MDFVIPIDSAVKGFFEHMKVNPRTILSSKFGDGKSYFLDKYKKTDFVSEHFMFLTIYPVNYQVASNEDIFSLIKRDILFQLMLNSMISDQVVVPNDIALWFYLQNNGKSLLSDLLSYLSAIAVPNEYKPLIMSCMKTLKLFKDMKVKFEKFKVNYDENALLDDFLSKVDNNTIYEDDIITAIIKRSIGNYKQRTHKEVVLVVEDLDRIDPAHLFRILNVFSAHIDYCYKSFVKPDCSLVGNKFNLDNIVLVCDYSNVRKIFKHFYGRETDFSGYIGKFLSSIPFNYSLQEERAKYIFEQLAVITECPVPLLRDLIGKDYFYSKTIRDVVHAIITEEKKQDSVTVDYNGHTIVLCPVMLRVLSVMRRLGWSDDGMRDIAKNVYEKSPNDFYAYFAPYMLLAQDERQHTGVSIYYRENCGSYSRQDVIIDEETGKGRRGSLFKCSGREEETDFAAIIECMLEYVAK